MAQAADIYAALWRPDEVGVTHVRQLIKPLRRGLARLRADPEKFMAYDAPNGWGVYQDFVPWVAGVLTACEGFPKALVRVSR